VAVIGAGPAGLFAAKQLAAEGATVVILNRDIKPGGLAEYGIYHDKHKMKEGLRKQFRQILAQPQIDYFGNVTVSKAGDVALDELRALGFQSVLVTVGAQGTKWQGLPGEDLRGVYHAKDLVYHYNRLPPFSLQPYAIGRRVAIIGVGNVMLDIAHWLVRDLKIDELIAVARRGPAEVKFDKAEMEYVAANLDLAALDAELERCRPIMESVGQDVAKARAYIVAGLVKAPPATSDTRFRFDFLASPSRIAGDENGRVVGLEVEDTTLVARDGDTKAKGLGTKRVIDVDTVVFAIGDRVDDTFGLPLNKWHEFVKNPQPHFPVEGISYEAFDPDMNSPIEGVFLAGWAREASSGLVGTARKDGTNAAKAVAQYLKTVPPAYNGTLEALGERLAKSGKPIVTKADWQRLEEVEQAEARKQGLESFKFASNEEMLKAIGI
jgi:ferredoxin--NADP+ reductase